MPSPRVRHAIKDVLIVVVGVLAVWLVLQAIFGTQNPFYVVSSGSMMPVLNVNDVLIVKNGATFETVERGDIIVFNRPSGHDRVIVHRVVDINEKSERIITTKGDANPASIPGTDFPIGKDDYIGKVIYVIPKIGIVTKLIQPPVNYIIIVIILAILFFNRTGRKKKEEQSEPISNQPTQPPESPQAENQSGTSLQSTPAPLDDAVREQKDYGEDLSQNDPRKESDQKDGKGQL